MVLMQYTENCVSCSVCVSIIYCMYLSIVYIYYCISISYILMKRKDTPVMVTDIVHYNIFVFFFLQTFSRVI